VTGRVAVVTGAAGGIGESVARRLAVDGERVRILDARPAGALVDAIRDAGGDAEAVVADVTDRAAVHDALARDGWRPELLVNVAGVFAFEDVLDPALDDWERTLSVNLGGVHTCCRAAAVHMRDRGFGRIVTVSSNAAVIGFRGMPSYAASKAGIIGLSRSLAADLGPHGITVNVVAPGSIAAGMGITSGWTSDPAMRAWDAARTPLPRVGHPDDVAGAVAFFVSDDAAWITGQTLVVDGGFSINGGPEPPPDRTEDAG
jgi:NAD(P)-dependent dehydrogenase (short-subunit alcohol dehydrogenase family)